MTNKKGNGLLTIRLEDELGCNISNTKAYGVGSKLVLVIDTKTDTSDSLEESIETLKSIGKHYTPTNGSKGKESVFLTELTNKTNQFMKYDIISFNGLDFKVELNTKVELEQDKPKQAKGTKSTLLSYEKAKEMLADGFLTKEDITAMIKDGRITM